MRHVAVALLMGTVLVAATGCPNGAAGPAGPPKFALRVNCGGEKDYVDKDGVKWLADKVLEGDAKWGALNGLTIRRTGLTLPQSKREDVYVTERYSAKGYEFSLENGTYTVRLHFAETYPPHTKEGLRQFTVKINGEPKLVDFDPFKAAGGFAKPVVRELKGIAVTDGKLKIEFVEKVQNPEINGIEILAY